MAGEHREHAARMGAASLLKKHGDIDDKMHRKIHQSARKRMSATKAKKPAVFGSLAPAAPAAPAAGPLPAQGAGHYMSTPTPTGSDEGF